MGIQNAAFALLVVASASLATPATGRTTDATVFARLSRASARAAARRERVTDCVVAFGDPWCDFGIASGLRFKLRLASL